MYKLPLQITGSYLVPRMWWYSRKPTCWITGSFHHGITESTPNTWNLSLSSLLTGQSPRSVGCSGRCVRSNLVSWTWCQNDFKRVDDNLSIVTVIWPSSLGWLPDSCNISWSRLRVERKGDKVVWRIFPCMFLDDSRLFQIRYQVPFLKHLVEPLLFKPTKLRQTFWSFPSRIDRNLWELGWWARGCVLRSSLSFPWRCQALGRGWLWRLVLPVPLRNRKNCQKLECQLPCLFGRVTWVKLFCSEECCGCGPAEAWL